MKNFENDYIYDLFMEYKAGSEDAYIEIINIYLKYVEEIIDKYFSDCNIEKEDLMSVGKIFLINALNSYRLDLDMNLKGYIYFWVKGHIEYYVNLEEKKQNISNSKIYEDYIKDINLLSTFDIDNIVEDREILQIIYNLFDRLNKRDKKMLSYYYGLEGIELSQRNIAELFNISKTNVNIRLNSIKKKVINELIEKGYISKLEEKQEKLRIFHM